MAPDVAIVAQPSCLDPMLGRVAVRIAPGQSLHEMIDVVLPGIPAALHARLRITIGEHVILPGLWRMVRPKAGAQVLIRAVPGDDGLRTVLNIAVTVGAIALGQFYAPLLAGSLLGLSGAATGTLTTLLSAAISGSTLLVGQLLINALIPTRSTNTKPTYAIQGFKNQATPDGAVPLVLGFVRFAPPYAMLPVTSANGDLRFVTANFVCGYGPLGMHGWRIGDTAIERYADVTMETRPGNADDARLTLTPDTVIEAPQNIELKSTATPTGGPQIRTTAADATGCSVDVNFPTGVYGVEKEGGSVPFTVTVRVRYRLAGDDGAAWIPAPSIVVTSKRTTPIVRTAPITFPERGRYEVELLRLTEDWDDVDQSKKSVRRFGRSIWSALRSYRPEYPIAFEKPLCLAAVHIRATGQLNGVLDELNAEFRTICPDWDAASRTWITRETNNPASLFRHVLTGPANAYPLDAAEVTGMEAWHAFCVAKGLTYNRVHAEDASVESVLADIAAAGRASPRNGGSSWSVVIDRARTFVSAHISPRNSWGFKGERSYATFPDAFRVPFFDETNGFKKAERIVPWPGFVGDPVVVQKIEFPGVTNPVQIAKEARRRQHELMLRADTYIVHQDLENLTYERADLAMLSHDVLDVTQVSARVTGVDGALVYLDEPVTFEADKLYACRFRRGDGTTLLRSVRTVVGESFHLTLTGPGEAPARGDLAFFGRSNLESFPCTVKAIEGMDNFTARVTLVDHAPEIEVLVDAYVPPPWSGRAGAEAQPNTGDPLTPTITGIVSGRQAADSASADNPVPVVVLVAAALRNTVTVASFEVHHRIAGTSVWSSASAPAATGAVVLAGYVRTNDIQVQARAVSDLGALSPWTAVETHTVSATDPAAPAAPQGLSAQAYSSTEIRGAVTSSPSAQAVATQLYIASGASAAFSAARRVQAPINSGPNAALTFAIPSLVAGPYRIWATALDANDPPVESPPADPVNVAVV